MAPHIARRLRRVFALANHTPGSEDSFVHSQTRLTIYSALLLSLMLTASSPADGPVRDVPPVTNPKRVVFLCDASKTMKDRFAVFAPEITKAVNALEPGQSFNIIFLINGKVVSLGQTLLPASKENKTKAADFVKKAVPAGATTAAPGMRAAFAVKPEVIYFATDGGFTDTDQLIQATHTLNKEKRVRIDTLAIFNRSERYEGVLKQIAEENGGMFKFIGNDERAP
jgi:hypothetical protein